MKIIWCCLLLAGVAYSLPQNAGFAASSGDRPEDCDCQCSRHTIEEQGVVQGDCKTEWPEFNGAKWCYIHERFNSCPDAKDSQLPYNDFKWSYFACTTPSRSTQFCREHHRKCSDSCTYEYQPVCGSDGNTYANPCLLEQEACKTNEVITVDSQGTCKEECQAHIFDNQHTCKFPFYHEGTEYRGCTALIGSYPTCKIDNAGDPLWATCYDSCPMDCRTSLVGPDQNEGEFIDYEDRISFRTNEICVFPFRYKGRTYEECSTVDNNGVPWCATTVYADNQEADYWGNCDSGSCGYAGRLPPVH